MEKQKTDRFTTEDVTFRNGRVKLAGTLMKPKGPGPWPAVVFVHGSGPAERGNPRDPSSLKGYFAERGIAVLMYDKRGCGKSTGDWRKTPFLELSGDALAGVRFLRHQPGILRGAIGVWGISQGGWIAPLMASQSRDVAFIVIVSAPAVGLEEQDKQRTVHELLAHGFPRERGLDAWADARAVLALTGDGRPRTVSQIRRSLRKARRRWWWRYLFGDVVPKSVWVGSILVGQSSWKKMRDHDPRLVLLRVRCPVLAVYGEKDRCVPVAENKPLLAAYLREARNPDVTIRVFPGADHNLCRTRTGSFVECVERWKKKAVRYVPGYRELMVRWVKSRTSRRRHRSK